MQIRNRITIIAPGSSVRISDRIQGKVLQACILPGGTVQYQISWFVDSGERILEWFYDFELENKPLKSEKVIITTV